MRRCPHRHFSSTLRNSRRNFPADDGRSRRRRKKNMNKVEKSRCSPFRMGRGLNMEREQKIGRICTKPKWKRFIFELRHTSPKHIASPSAGVRLCVCVGDKMINQLQRNDVVRITIHLHSTFQWLVRIRRWTKMKSQFRPFSAVSHRTGVRYSHINYSSLASSRCIHIMDGGITPHHLY